MISSARPGLAGLYFRDIGYFSLPSVDDFSENQDLPSTPTRRREAANRSDDPRFHRINQFFRLRFESLMNTEFSHRITVTVCPNLHEAPDPVLQDNTYESWHLWFIEHGAKLKTPPLRFPPFLIAQLIASVPDGIALSAIDRTLSAGWANRRETRAGTDVKTAGDLLQVSANSH